MFETFWAAILGVLKPLSFMLYMEETILEWVVDIQSAFPNNPAYPI